MSDVEEVIYNTMLKMFPRLPLQNGPTGYVKSNWNNQSYFYGSHSFIPIGGFSSDYDILAESINDKLFFAGEHTHRKYRATMHGAYLSGAREANKIMKSL